jgi:hypothetical protein
MSYKAANSAHFAGDKKMINVSLTLIEFKEDGLFFIYSPALDLTGYGKTQDEARNSYDIAMEEFLKYTSNKKTAFKVLEKLGWTIAKNQKVTAPTLSTLIQKRSYLEEILSEKDFYKTQENVAIPAYGV